MPPHSTDYIPTLIQEYLALPDTPNRCSRQDLALAQKLYQQQVPWPLIQASFALASLRRAARLPDALPLSPIRSLAYFLPILEELRHASPLYWDYCCRRFRATQHPRPSGHQYISQSL